MPRTQVTHVAQWQESQGKGDGWAAGGPELPRGTVDTTLPNTAGYVTYTVKASGGTFTSLHTAVNSTSPAVKNATTGIILVVDAGYVINEPVTLPVHTNPWVIIQSSALASLPAAGTRAGPSDASNMPTITVDTVGGVKPAVINNVDGAHHYRFVGLNVTANTGLFVYYLLKFQGVTLSSAAASPHHMIVDRCYIHAQDAVAGGTYVGVQLDGTYMAVVDSYISDIANNQNQETQGINSWNGGGPFTIVNNYIEASGENIMFGGTDAQIANLTPSDITVRFNHCSKPLRWKKDDAAYSSFYTNNNPVVKNIFELKHAQRALVSDNLFEYNWGAQGQDGISILFNPRNQAPGLNPWTVVQDVTFTRNIIRHVGGGFNILGTDDAFVSQQTTRIDITHNLWYDVGDESGGTNPWGYQQWGQLTPPGGTYVRILHNTIHQGGRIFTLPSPVATGDKAVGFVFQDNLVAHNLYGVFANGGALGQTALDNTFTGYVFTNNALWGPNTNGVTYPPGNFQPADITAVGFTNYAAANYLLTSSSPHHSGNAQDATDGTDLGVDTTRLP